MPCHTSHSIPLVHGLFEDLLPDCRRATLARYWTELFVGPRTMPS
jgi:hypothetical protein